MTDQEKLVLLANVEPLIAEEILRERGSELTAGSVRKLTMLATGDELAAQDAMSDRIADQLRKNQPVEL